MRNRVGLVAMFGLFTVWPAQAAEDLPSSIGVFLSADGECMVPEPNSAALTSDARDKHGFVPYLTRSSDRGQRIVGGYEFDELETPVRPIPTYYDNLVMRIESPAGGVLKTHRLSQVSRASSEATPHLHTLAVDEDRGALCAFLVDHVQRPIRVLTFDASTGILETEWSGDRPDFPDGSLVARSDACVFESPMILCETWSFMEDWANPGQPFQSVLRVYSMGQEPAELGTLLLPLADEERGSIYRFERAVLADEDAVMLVMYDAASEDSRHEIRVRINASSAEPIELVEHEEEQSASASLLEQQGLIQSRSLASAEARAPDTSEYRRIETLLAGIERRLTNLSGDRRER